MSVVVRLLGPLVVAGGVVRSFLYGMTGQSRYAAYVAHERAAHPDREPLDEREFWRSVYREQERDPGSRCC
ncbi:YbdD/YjiX family protein [Microbacterium betulae]|uniref:YbdD/YjiX family protein n=1 Tax=Microbacterium betulae TaxID=2981139 RepID=A0AA97FKA3_9MICO|nr:YbdD/YjiX family protein [Microbacterium sp. AB]WOF24379.1 YbdD/YjiX family protein [Microbacterium sp. AB]